MGVGCDALILLFGVLAILFFVKNDKKMENTVGCATLRASTSATHNSRNK